MSGTHLKKCCISLISNLRNTSFENWTLVFCFSIRFAKIELCTAGMGSRHGAQHCQHYLWTGMIYAYCLIHLELFLMHFMMIFVLFLLSAELFSPWHEATTTCNSYSKQFRVLAGIRRYLCLWVFGWQRLSEFLLLLWRMQIRILEKRTYSHRHLGTGLILTGLFPYIIPALQLGLLGGIPLSLTLLPGDKWRALDSPLNFHHPQTSSD